MKKKDKNTIIWTVAIIAVIAGIFGIYKLSQSPEGGPDNGGGGAASVILALKKDDWAKGSENAKNVLIEYSDFQCPACRNFVPILEDLASEFSSDLKIVYRHFPLPQHANAILAGQASESAGIQGKFWEMYDLLFEKQSEWENNRRAEDIFKQYASVIGIDAEKFTQDLNSEEVENAVKSDLKDAQRLKLNSTPTFILNGEKLKDFKSYDEFRNLIKQAILESQS